jgi:hypothetical protein
VVVRWGPAVLVVEGGSDHVVGRAGVHQQRLAASGLVEDPSHASHGCVEPVRGAKELTRTEPVHHFPAGITSVVGLLIDTLRDIT